jgi:predicted nucleic acid-binding protein
MKASLLDTCIIIDYLRDRAEAVDFMTRLVPPPLVSVVTAAELFAGVRSVAERHQTQAVLERMSVQDVDLEIAMLGGIYCRRYRRSHGVEIPDALIAATAEVHGARLVTRNARHFPMVDDLVVPYRWS